MNTGLPLYTQVWRFIITFSIYAAAVIIPLGLIFPDQFEPMLVNLETLLIPVYFADLIYNNLSRKGGDKKRSYFLIVADLAAVVPYGLLGGGLLHLIRLVKLVRVVRYFNEWKQYQIKYSEYLSFAFFLFWFSLLSHWLACVWIVHSVTTTIAGYYETYITALYWVIQTLTTVGYGDVPPQTSAQKILTIFVMLFGAGLYGYLIGRVASILSGRDPSKTYYMNNISRLRDFVKYRRLPQDLQLRIKEYYDFMWNRKHGFDELSLLQSLPPSLKSETALFLKKDLLNKIPVIKDSPDEFKKELALNFKSIVFSPGDLICREGEVGMEMYFIIKGELKVSSASRSGVIAILGDGDFFGEISLFKNAPRTANVHAVTYSDLYILEKNDFERILQHFPSVSEQIRITAEERNEILSGAF